ncbi:MAG TPA: amino acid permease [Kofleriaceae bacterium]
MTPAEQPLSVRNEQVLVRQLSSVQQAMMAIGGAIGTGLFLSTGLSVGIAGPAIIVSYVIVAGISLLLGRAVSEMAVAHPTPGAFGVHAALYVSPFAGYAVRVSYWLMEVIATGGHLTAAATYMRFWFPEVHGAVWVLGFAVVLLYLNSRAVGRLARIEYWLVLIKVTAVAVFVAIAILLVVGATGQPAVGVRNLTDHGFAPFGASGIWFGCCFGIYSFIGCEIVGVTSGEAADPARSIPRAMRRSVLGLSAIYIVTITLLTAITPWQQLSVDKSPFVTALSGHGIPAAAGVMNFVVLSAALSSSNANLYLISRTLFSLARGGFAPRSLGELSRRGTPVNALLASGLGLAAAVVIEVLWEGTAYQILFALSLFGALFVWLMIFVTHIAFRGRRLPFGSYLGLAAIAAILVSTWWVPLLRTTLLAGGPWLAILGIGYVVSRRRTPG